jgi:hypothetical protein
MKRAVSSLQKYHYTTLLYTEWLLKVKCPFFGNNSEVYLSVSHSIEHESSMSIHIFQRLLKLSMNIYEHYVLGGFHNCFNSMLPAVTTW